MKIYLLHLIYLFASLNKACADLAACTQPNFLVKDKVLPPRVKQAHANILIDMRSLNVFVLIYLSVSNKSAKPRCSEPKNLLHLRVG